MSKTRTISMAQTIQNVNIMRTETTGITTIDSNTCHWATSLTDTNGNSLQCDADNGGETKRLQILVPSEHMETVKQNFREYKESISLFTKREVDFTSTIQEASPPEAIYVPTAAVHSNSTLIQKRSSFTVWKQAPASVCSPTGTPISGYTPPTQQRSQYTPPSAQYPLFPNAEYPLLLRGNPSITPQAKVLTSAPKPLSCTRHRHQSPSAASGQDNTNFCTHERRHHGYTFSNDEIDDNHTKQVCGN